MKTKAILVLLFICFINTSFSQDFWEEIDFPYGTSIWDITIDNQSQIFIGAGNGVYSTSNFGTDWEYLGLNRMIRDVENDNNTIYAAASQSQWWSGLWRTEDSGYKWDSIIPNIGVTGNVIDILPLGDTIFTSIWTYNTSLFRSIDNGETWELVFTKNSSNEYVSDIIISANETIYFSLDAYSDSMGGVYKSIDWGDTWEFIGLLNYGITSLALNNENDLFAGSFGGLSDSTSSGLFVLRNGENNWTSLLVGASIQDIETNCEGHVYFTSYWPSGVYRTIDDGVTFENIGEGLPQGNPVKLTMDNNGYLYSTGGNFIARSINPIVSVHEKYTDNNNISIFPNPAADLVYINLLNTTDKLQYDELSINDITGSVLLSSTKKILTNTNAINISFFTPGVYFVKIRFKNKIETSKFIKL